MSRFPFTGKIAQAFRGISPFFSARLFFWLEWLLVCLLIWQLSGLFWAVFSPSTRGVGLALPRPVGEGAQQSSEAFLRWYGADPSRVVQATSSYSLMAVIAGERGAALLKASDGSSVAVRVGEEIRPGMRLLAVEPTGVRIEQGGIRQEISFPQTDSQTLFSRAERSGPGQSGGARALKPVRITRGQMVAAMQGGNVGGWDKGLSSAPDGGIRIDRAASQPFAKLLLLKDGDLLKRINQRPLERLADISLISFYFGQHASVDIDLIRDGILLTQHYDIQP